MLYSMAVPTVVFLEHLIGLVIMTPIFYKDIIKLRISRKEFISFFWVALFGGAIGTMSITKALFYVNLNHLSVIILLQKLQPVFAIFLAHLVLKERPRKGFYTFAFIALIGSYFLTFGFDMPVIEGNKLFIASLLSVLAAFSFGSSTVFGKRGLKKMNNRAGTFLRFAFTTVIMFVIVLGVITFNGQASAFSGFGFKELIVLFGIAMSTGAFAIFIYYYELKLVPTTHATLYELMFPLTAVILDYIVNGTVLSFGRWFGAILLIFSVVAITFNNKKT